MIEYYTIKTADATGFTEPVDAAACKDFMRVDYVDDDTLIEAMVKSARRFLQKRMNKPLVKTDYVVRVRTGCEGDAIDLPAYETGDVAITDLDNDSVLLTADEYVLSGALLKVNYKGFYSVAYTVDPTVDDDVKEAIKMLVAYRYNNRGDQERQAYVPQDIEAIIEQNRAWVL